MHADRSVRRSRAAGNHRDARTAGELRVRIGHVRGAAFLATDDEAHAIAVAAQPVEHRQIALARHAEYGVDALADEGVRNDVPADALARGRGAVQVASPSVVDSKSRVAEAASRGGG